MENEFESKDRQDSLEDRDLEAGDDLDSSKIEKAKAQSSSSGSGNPQKSKSKSRLPEHAAQSALGARLFYFITYGLYYLTLIVYKNPLRDIILLDADFSIGNLFYVVYYVGVHALAIHYFLTAGANPGFVAMNDDNHGGNEEYEKKVMEMVRLEHSPSGLTDDSVEDWVDSSPQLIKRENNNNVDLSIDNELDDNNIGFPVNRNE